LLEDDAWTYYHNRVHGRPYFERDEIRRWDCSILRKFELALLKFERRGPFSAFKLRLIQPDGLDDYFAFALKRPSTVWRLIFLESERGRIPQAHCIGIVVVYCRDERDPAAIIFIRVGAEPRARIPQYGCTRHVKKLGLRPIERVAIMFGRGRDDRASAIGGEKMITPSSGNSSIGHLGRT